MKSNITIADNHCHLSKEYYPNPLETVTDLEANSGLEYVASMGVNNDNNAELIELKKNLNKKFLKIGAGLHPEQVIELGKFYKHELDRIIEQIKVNSDVIDFIGEIGMDFFYPNAREFEKEQKEAFSSLVKLAVELKKPMSIHAREAFDEIIDVLEETLPEQVEYRGYLHCFTGNFDQGMYFIEKGFKLGLSGIITYKKSDELRQTVKDLLEFYKDKDFNDIFGLETDAPYLSPEPIRSETNSPKNVKIIAEYIDLLIY